MGLDHGGLDGADVVTGFEEVGREGMTECVAGDALGQPGLANGLADVRDEPDLVFTVPAVAVMETVILWPPSLR